VIKRLLLLCEFIFLCLGVYLPLAVIDEFWILSSEFSLLNLTERLLIEREWVLGFVVFLFGILFPILKIIIRLLNVKILEKFNLHRFSMVDIFLLSFLVFSGKLSKFYELELLIGFYFLLTSILLGYIQIIFQNMRRKKEVNAQY